MSTWIRNLGVAAALLAASVAAGSAQAQNYPTRAVTLVIPFAPGGSTSIVGRAIADKISEVLGEKVVIDNRPGAGGTAEAERHDPGDHCPSDHAGRRACEPTSCRPTLSREYHPSRGPCSRRR